MRIWFDMEFIEDGRAIDPLSIGMVREDGRTLYMQNEDCNQHRANEWVREHVLPKLDKQYDSPRIIREVVREFAGDRPEFWADYGAYDWVALCQLFGAMVHLPKGWPMFCRDFQQLIDGKSWQPNPIEPLRAHHALNDALWLRKQWVDYTAFARVHGL